MNPKRCCFASRGWYCPAHTPGLANQGLLAQPKTCTTIQPPPRHDPTVEVLHSPVLCRRVPVSMWRLVEAPASAAPSACRIGPMRCSATPSAGMMSPLEHVARVFFLFLVKRTGSENAVKRVSRLFRWFLHRGPVRRHSSMWFQAAAPQNPCLNFRCSTYFCSPSSRRRTRQVPDRAARNVLALHEAILVLAMHGARPGGTDLCPGLPGGAWEEPGLGRRTLAEGLFRAGEHPGLTSGWPGHDLLPEVSGTSQCVGVPKGPTSPPNGDICIDDCLILCIVTCIIMYSIILTVIF